MAENKRVQIHRAIAAYYEARLAEHGPTARGVDWRDELSQRLRHHQFDRLIGEDRTAMIGDLGCGYGDYLAYLRATGYCGRYVGYDLAPDMLHVAERLHGSGLDRAWVLDAAPRERLDYVIASGIFNVRGDVDLDDWESYVSETIEAMAAAAIRGFGFNMLTIWSDADKRRPELYYGAPSRWLDHCASRFGRRIAVMQDYGLFEFTLLCRVD